MFFQECYQFLVFLLLYFCFLLWCNTVFLNLFLDHLMNFIFSIEFILVF